MKQMASVFFVTALLLFVPNFGSAAALADLSGTWEMDAARSDSAHSSAASGPVTVVIKQTETELSIETRQGGQSETIIYKLDGSETEKSPEDNGPFRWRARWDGSRLITEIHRNINRSTITINEVHSIDTDTKEMTIERTLTVQHGYTMRGGKNYSSGKDLFVKTS